MKHSRPTVKSRPVSSKEAMDPRALLLHEQEGVINLKCICVCVVRVCFGGNGVGECQ